LGNNFINFDSNYYRITMMNNDIKNYHIQSMVLN